MIDSLVTCLQMPSRLLIAGSFVTNSSKEASNGLQELTSLRQLLAIKLQNQNLRLQRETLFRYGPRQTMVPKCLKPLKSQLFLRI